MTAPVLEVHLSESDASDALRRDVRAGLAADPKWLPPKWLYDARGSELFEEITELPEYYPTRTERALLRAAVAEIATVSAADTLVELGSGSSEKTRLLLDACSATGLLRRYVPQDVSESALRGAANAVADEYPQVAVHGVVGDFTRQLDRLPGSAGGRRLMAFLGGTIGNLLPAERAEFLAAVHAVLEPGESLLLGAGLVTDPDVLERAYDDSAGVTAEFDRNVLRVLNRELNADFDVDAFVHRSVWVAEHEWIEMRLRASRAMTVRLRDLDMTVQFADGEELHTEVSAKFRLDGLAGELDTGGFDTTRTWTDDDQRYALVLGTRR